MVLFPCISLLHTNICVITGRRGRNNELSILYVRVGIVARTHWIHRSLVNFRRELLKLHYPLRKKDKFKIGNVKKDTIIDCIKNQ